MNLGSNFSTENEPDYDDKLTYILNHEIGNKLIPYLKQHLLDCLFYSTCCEVRHFFYNFDNNERKNYKNNNKEFYEFISKLEEEKEEITRESAFNYFKDSGISPYKLVSEFKKIFELNGWNRQYGGEPWANICKAYIDLYNAKSFNQQLIQIDHVYDLQHNTGFALNKVEDYSNNYEIKNILDHKRYIKSLYELVEFASPSFKNLALRLIKSKFGTSYQHHLNNYENDDETVFNYARVFNFLMKNPSEKVKLTAHQLNMIKHDSNSIQFIDNPSEKLQLVAVSQNGYSIQFIENPSETVKLAAVQQSGYAIKFIENPSEAIQLAAVRQNGYAIKLIKNPSEAVQLAAARQNIGSIQYIANPSEKVQLAAVSQNGYSIKHINNPSKAVQLAAVREIGNAIKFIKNPSEEIKLTAVEKNGYIIKFIENPSEEIQLAAVRNVGGAIEYIENPSEEIQLAAIQRDPNSIQYIENPSEGAKLATVQQNGLLIKYIKNPSKKVQIAAVQQNSNAFVYIKNPIDIFLSSSIINNINNIKNKIN
jgi:hypothetical protein